MWVRFPPGPPSRRRRGLDDDQLGPLAAASAALHLALVLLLVLRHRDPQQDVSPPPAELALVFQSGAKDVATAPEAAPQAPPPAPTPSPEPAPAPIVEPAAPQVAAETPAPPTVRVTPPAPAVPLDKLATAEIPLPTLRPPVPVPVPLPRPPAPPIRRAPAPAASGSGRFPAPLMRSFSIPSAASASSNPLVRDFTAADPAVLRGPRHAAGVDVQGADRLGSAWFNAFMGWVEQHKHYPEQAIANDEDGSSQVEFTVGRDGRVREVFLVSRSGSVWLDAGLTGMFRSARLPSFPYNVADDAATIRFTMHYILSRR